MSTITARRALHGFATPLLAAAALHSALDGWSAAASQTAGFSMALIGGIAVHKIPEGLALGVIARASLGTRASALAWCALAQMATIAGAGFESVLAPHLSSQGLHALLALAGGSFLYLGGHAVHGELRRSGNRRWFRRWPESPDQASCACFCVKLAAQASTGGRRRCQSVCFWNRLPIAISWFS